MGAEPSWRGTWNQEEGQTEVLLAFKVQILVSRARKSLWCHLRHGMKGRRTQGPAYGEGEKGNPTLLADCFSW